MQNIRLFNVREARRASRRHWKANVLHRPVQAKIWISILIFTFYIIIQIYLIIFHPNPLIIFEKWNILFVTEVLEQPANESHVHNVVAIREWRHTNVDKQR